MKNFLLGSALLACFFFQTVYCISSPAFVDIPQNCTFELKRQIRMEIKASLTYLKMATHFALPTLNRPGFSEFFFKSANEERDHAIKFLDYLMMRGDLLNINELSQPTFVRKDVWNTGLEALNGALAEEVAVTKSIKSIIGLCESDYHLADYLTTEFMDEQHKGMRDIAGMISTLKMSSANPISEFLYDKKLLKGELLK